MARPLHLLALLAVLLAAAPAHARSDREIRAELIEVDARLHELAGPRPLVVLVTMGIGSLIWERHGHIALCVLHDNPGRDDCYNYGVADFHRPLGMAWGFLRGTRSFWVQKFSPRDMLHVYVHFDRTIWAQPLAFLDTAQTKAVIDKLEHDILEQNRYYAYDHFEDNCTTRVRDILDDVTGRALSTMPDPGGADTFRDLARDGFFGMRIPLLITDLAMGRSTDRVPTYWERMFLPQYLREAAHQRWSLDPVMLYQRKGEAPLDDGPSGRLLFALVIIALTAPAWATRLWGRLQRTGLWFAVLPPVVLGTAFWVIAIISPLPYARWNETCLILLPLDLALVLLSAPRARRYARFRVAMLVLVGLLNLLGVIKAPLLAPLLWPLIPAAVVGFWPRAGSVASRATEEASSEPEAKATPDKSRPQAARTAGHRRKAASRR